MYADYGYYTDGYLLGVPRQCQRQYFHTGKNGQNVC